MSAQVTEDKNEIKAKMDAVQQEEQELQFDSFDNDTAWRLGSLMVQEAKARKLPIAIDITRSGQQLFRHALAGTSPDNSEWIARKTRLVNRFYVSSYAMHLRYRFLGTTMMDRHAISPVDYAASGGCFPLRIRSAGMLGTITVSGLPHEEDHRFIVDILRRFLKENAKGQLSSKL